MATLPPADDHGALGMLDRRIHPFAVSLHQIAARQKFIGRIDALQVLARHVHEVRQAGAAADEDRFVSLIEQVVHRFAAADHGVCLDLHAHLAQTVDLVLNDRLGQTEFRDTIHQHASGDMQRFENRDMISFFGQIARAGQAGRSCHRRQRRDVRLPAAC